MVEGGGQVWRPAKRTLFAHFFSWGVLSGCVQHPSKNSLSHEDGPSQVAVFPTSIAAAFAASPEEAAGAGSCNNLKKKKTNRKRQFFLLIIHTKLLFKAHPKKEEQVKQNNWRRLWKRNPCWLLITSGQVWNVYYGGKGVGDGVGALFFCLEMS